MKFKIHHLYYVIAFIFFITGHFKFFSIYTLIILVHELGHIFAGIVLKWKISKVTLYPFGCVTSFDHKLNSSNLEEFLILIYGPLFQIIFNMIFKFDISKYILIFNLLPIYPLDGSKFIFMLCTQIMSYYNSYIVIYIISYLTIIILLLMHINLINILVFMYLVYDIYRNISLLPNIMLKFYYERYKDTYIFKKNKYIYKLKLKKMFKNRNNYFINNNKILTEKEALKNIFLNK